MNNTNLKNQNPFKKAKALKLKVKTLVMGESGTGKTMRALQLATALAKLEGGRVAFIDSENGKALFYAPYFDFDHMALANNSPQAYIDAMRQAEKHGYSVIVVDSFTHAWSGDGGVLDIVDKNKKGWAVGKPEHHKMVAAIHKAHCHIIGTVRLKNSFDKDPNGKIDWNSAQVDARQEGEFEYEFDLSLVLDRNHTATVRMSKCFDVKAGASYEKDGHPALAETLHNWANAGDEPPKWYEAPAARARLAGARDKMMASKIPPTIIDNALVALSDYDAFIDEEDFFQQLREKVKDLQDSPYTNITQFDASQAEGPTRARFTERAASATGTDGRDPNEPPF